MKMLIAAVLTGLLGILGVVQAQKAQKNSHPAPSSPVENHGQEKSHEHGKEGHEHGKEEAHEHGKEEAHEHGKEGHEEGERRNVGPDKGVLEASEDLGFKLRDGVEERFGIKSQTISSNKSEKLPKEAIVYSKEEYQIFRKRGGFWKPIDVKTIRKGASVIVESDDLKAGDSVAIEGTGFLKIVELSVFGPAIEGHIH